MTMKIPVEISARHVHLSQKDADILFGKNYIFKKKKDLSQPGEFAAEETVMIRANNKEFSNVRVITPQRIKTQVEISLTDAYYLGLNAPIRLSGELKDTPGIVLIGPKGEVQLEEGVIVAQRHLHISPIEAMKSGIDGQDVVSIKIDGPRSLTFHNIKVRRGEKFKLSVHLDTDEGNSAGINQKTTGELI
jgi:propanediol utilization protein